jgi:hypothetical protein
MSALVDVRLGDDFQEGHAGAVEIHAAVPVEMGAFADVLLQMRAGDADAGEAALELEIEPAVARGGLVVLGDLVILGHVGIEVVLAVELGKGAGISQWRRRPVRTVNWRASSLATGRTPGRPRQTGQTRELGGAPNSLAQAHHIFDFVLSWT